MLREIVGLVILSIGRRPRGDNEELIFYDLGLEIVSIDVLSMKFRDLRQ